MIRVNLLGISRKTRKRLRAPVITLGGGLTLGLLVAVLVVVAAVQFFRYRGLQSEIAQLDQQIQSLQREKADLSRVQGEYETNLRRRDLLTQRINIIEGLRAKQSGPAQLLDALATTITASNAVWLIGFEQTGNQIKIEGVALSVKAVADLLTRLLGTQTFAAMDLTETSQDLAEKEFGKFNFVLTGQLAPPPPPPRPFESGNGRGCTAVVDGA